MGLAVARLAAVPVFFAAERLVAHPTANTEPFGPLLAVAAVYAAVALAAELLGRPLARPPVLAAVDLLLIAALVATSGGPFSELRYAFFLLPIGAALLLRPALTAAVSAGSLALYIAIAVAYPEDAAGPGAVDFEVAQALFLAWMGGTATLLSMVLTRRSREIAQLATSRNRLLAEALQAEDFARRRLAESLHDDALQNLLAARQMLQAGDPADLVLPGLNQSVAQLRDAVFDLHPYLLEQAGLGAALDAVAQQAGRRAGFAARVTVDDEAEGEHDALLFAIGRELVANAAKHSGAAHVEVTVRRHEDAVELVVADDGRGLDPSAVREAPVTGHIGLASCAERAQAAGGSLELGSGLGDRGTAVRVRLPALPRPADAVLDPLDVPVLR
jgi:two-component system, NarL family, sensor kinase